jgi:hypothetical protein
MNSLTAKQLFYLLGAALLVSAAATTDDETAQKKEKSFSIFSVVNFQNTQCRSNDALPSGSSNNRNGTWFTTSECSAKGGAASGNCASGFGVCCIFKVSAATTTINQNNTYIQNPSFPAVYSGTATTLSYKVSKVASNICFLRLDFETFTITGPADSKETTGGTCNTDTFKITGPTKEKLPLLCGKNTGQHVYVDFGTDISDQVSLDFAFTGTSTTRTWEVKTSQIECSSNYRPPAGCLQYFTTLTGRITTFNFLDDATTHLASQDYNVCVKKQDGFCCVQYQVCSDQTLAFSLDQTTASATKQIVDSGCATDYVRIPGSSQACTSQPGTAVNNKYCGGFLGPLTDVGPNSQICDCDEPFQLSIHTDAAAETGSATTRSRGLCLDYSQLPCQTN